MDTLKQPLQIKGSNVVSILEIADIRTGERTVLAEFDYLIEAPNWTSDGTRLIYNSQGRIYSFDLATRESSVTDTGFAEQCNNDHVLSPDGTMLTYCAERNGQYDIYTIPVTGGVEIQLTDLPGLDDGPEYSPDGKHIWYNSVRTGLMQVWRMNADGSEQTQMTFEESNNWFPHVSPDGETVAYLAYRKGDVEPGGHPANRNVEIRLISSSGGESCTLVKLFGGQGTINVNSWSPDSKQLAFVSYRMKG